MRETGKEREEMKASSPKRNFINKEDGLLTVLVCGFYSQTPLQITKITKQTILQWGQIRKKTKK